MSRARVTTLDNASRIPRLASRCARRPNICDSELHRTAKLFPRSCKNLHPKHPRPSIESLIHFTTSLSPSSRRQRARVSTDHEHQAMSNTHRSCWRFSPSLLPTSPHPRGSQPPPVHHALFWRALLLFAPNAARAVEEQLRRGAPIRLGRHIVIQTRRWVERPAGRGRAGVGCGARQRPPGRAQRRRQRATDQRTLRRNRRGERRWIVPRRDGRRGELRGGCVRRLWK